MAIYSVGRKRVILALLLTTILLLTLDLRSNPVIDGVRNGFAIAMRPVEAATGVVTNPLQRAWNGVVNYDDLRRENQALQEQVDRLIGTQAAAEAAVVEGQELQALYSLPSLSGIETEVARVVGAAASNIDQVIEIDKGSRSGIQVGMPVVNQAGLVGKVTKVFADSARVMLVTDARYTVAVKVTSSDEPFAAVPTVTTPSGLAPDEVIAAATTTTTPPPPPSFPTATFPNGLPVPETTLPGGGAGVFDENGRRLSAEEVAALEAAIIEAAEAAEAAEAPPTAQPAVEETTTTSTTTTTVPIIDKEYGALEGRGRFRLPQIRFIQNSPSLAVLQAGDLVETAGGSESLAPPGIPIGRVLNRADRPGSAGPLLDVQIHADLARLNFVRVVLYKPLSEVGQ